MILKRKIYATIEESAKLLKREKGLEYTSAPRVAEYLKNKGYKDNDPRLEEGKWGHRRLNRRLNRLDDRRRNYL